MPVRVLIHESAVSTSVARSSFVMTSSGAQAPTPIGFDFRRERPGTGATSAAAAALTSSTVVAKRKLFARVTAGSDGRTENVAPSTSDERPRTSRMRTIIQPDSLKARARGAEARWCAQGALGKFMFGEALTLSWKGSARARSMRRLALLLYSVAAFAPSALPKRAARTARSTRERAGVESDDTWAARFSLEKSWTMPYPSPHAPPPRRYLDDKPVDTRMDVLLWPHDAVARADAGTSSSGQPLRQEPAISPCVTTSPTKGPQSRFPGVPNQSRDGP